MPGFLLVRAVRQGIFPLLLTSMLRALLELSRVSNLPTVWTNVLAAWIIASGANWQWTPALGWLLLGASLIYSAGMILNDACDAAWDRKHRKERPIPSGRIGLKTVWFISLAGLAIGYALMVFAGGASWKITALLVAAVVAYDVYHKPWAGSVVIMGACRTLLYLAAGSADAELFNQPSNFQLFIVEPGVLLGLYVVGLTLIARAEPKGKMRCIVRWAMMGCMMTPVVWSLFINGVHKGYGPILWWVPIPLFILWTTFALDRMAKGGPAIGQAVGLLLAGIPLVDAMFIGSFSFPPALVFCALPPFLRLWQRWIAAT